MSQKPFRVHLYRLKTGDKSAPLEDVLTKASLHALKHRTRSLLNQDYRLEEIVPPTDGHPYWLLDFGKFRYDGGPGKASPTSPIESFEMADDEGFAEETAVLYDMKHGYLVIQYNHHGPRAGAISTYLNCYDVDNLNDFEFLLQLNPAAQARLDKKKVFTKLIVKVAPAKLTKDFKKANVALTTLLARSQQEFGGDYVSITVGLDAFSNASLKLAQWLKAFKSLASEDRDAVKELKISGRDEVGDAVDPVDLISEKLETTLTDIGMDAGHRYVRGDRFGALVRAYNGWRKQHIIT